ncbi:dienelactone hydrolase [Sinomonas atrocyanea]|uniref:Dienelactone hydrolase n=1 Tax=Sinomonas atrocyanea TaxID=37927 RepID=A0A127A0W8_9MICC|nr:dienelactone hydrolase family protein [Sinomonas atrocyanea]AMM32454.1 dienelactone hydrolase [Sinomonas atrocyanea]GEB63553.1 dienelactone hydrolase [Sinomonas atrocyanea]GGG59991.1 dienelactone hydrolase [Sinomonas atrocyanea]
MADILLFHHALGLTPGVASLADTLIRNGHTVTTPDLFEGRMFATIDEGVAHAREIGFDEIMARGERAASSLPQDLVYMGLSLGVLPAQKLAQTRAGARGAVFFYSCVPAEEFGGPWPAGVPLQVHGAEQDPIFMEEGDVDAARAIVAGAPDAELFLYPSTAHYFADSTQTGFDAASASLAVDRVLAFLERI